MCFGGGPKIPPPPPPPVPPPPPAPTAMTVQKAPTESGDYRNRMSTATRAGKSSLIIPLAGAMSGGTGIGTTP